MPRATKPIPKAVVVDLAEPARARLRRLAASVTAQVRQVRQVLRAKIALAAADGLANAAIACEVEVSVNTVRKLRGRFACGVLVALADARRSGRPHVYGPQVRVVVVASGTATPERPRGGKWTSRGGMARPK
jgi:hypothetical protein